MHCITLIHRLIDCFPNIEVTHIEVIRKIVKIVGTEANCGILSRKAYNLSKSETKWAIKNSAYIAAINVRLGYRVDNCELFDPEPELVSEVDVAKTNASKLFSRIIYRLHMELYSHEHGMSYYEREEFRCSVSRALDYLSLPLRELNWNHKAYKLVKARQGEEAWGVSPEQFILNDLDSFPRRGLLALVFGKTMD